MNAIRFADLAVTTQAAPDEDHGARMRRLAFALSYPFSTPVRSFVFVGGHGAAPLPADPSTWNAASAGLSPAEAIAVDALSRFDFNAATAVVAAGSNASPMQLTRKYAVAEGDPSAVVIPCLKIAIPNFVSCYSRQIAPYGSVPTMIVPHEGATTVFTVNLLDPVALQRLNETEALGTHYELAPLGHIAGSGHRSVDGMAVHGYRAVSGSIPFRLASLPTENCDLPPLDQRQMQEELIARLGLSTSVEDFALANIYDADHRTRVVEMLARLAF